MQGDSCSTYRNGRSVAGESGTREWENCSFHHSRDDAEKLNGEFLGICTSHWTRYYRRR